jgi:hypothetical protein
MPMQTVDAVAPIRVPVWSWVVALLSVLVLYAVAVENGALLAQEAERVHEFFHDARHFLAVPCH